MTGDNNGSQITNEELQLKQSFLSDAISDIAGNIRFLDTKVSIIMAAIVAMIGGVLASINTIESLVQNISPCSWLGVLIIFLSIICLISTISVFIFGINTIKGRISNFQYNSKWFLTHPMKKYSFTAYKNDVLKMNSQDIIENMTAELYKLNDINKQKMKSMRRVIIAFSTSLISAFLLGLVLSLVGG
ncbi:hypothetical protein K6L05_08625 [Salinicoccus roseus]|uniref:hypothetical protein n=1 Tax=Salinicoccus roseus TaxID=45670 RepID=UPI001CA76259|nr:hypothetical protein [Salinicoccus roseus]MBY8909855.1 hypothetical protein [Salinicoccus roseus]